MSQTDWTTWPSFLFSSKLINLSVNKDKLRRWIWCTLTKMIAKFLRKRNKNLALPFNKNFATIQVRGNSQMFQFKKIAISQQSTNRILTEAGNILNTEAANRLTTG